MMDSTDILGFRDLNIVFLPICINLCELHPIDGAVREFIIVYGYFLVLYG